MGAQTTGAQDQIDARLQERQKRARVQRRKRQARERFFISKQFQKRLKQLASGVGFSPPGTPTLPSRPKRRRTRPNANTRNLRATYATRVTLFLCSPASRAESRSAWVQYSTTFHWVREYARTRSLPRDQSGQHVPEVRLGAERGLGLGLGLRLGLGLG